jgi:hypothetical protein
MLYQYLPLHSRRILMAESLQSQREVLESVSYLPDSENTENHAPLVLLNARHISICHSTAGEY